MSSEAPIAPVRQQSLTRNNLRVMHHTCWESGKETFWSQTLRNRKKMDASEIHAKRLNAKEVLTPMSGENFHVPDRRWNGQTLWRRSGTENIHLNPGSPRPRRRTRTFSARIRPVFFTTFSRLITVWWWSKIWFLVQFRALNLPSSRWTQSQTVRAERSVIPNSTEVTWPGLQVGHWM